MPLPDQQATLSGPGKSERGLAVMMERDGWRER